jgi:hypothetical protein
VTDAPARTGRGRDPESDADREAHQRAVGPGGGAGRRTPTPLPRALRLPRHAGPDGNGKDPRVRPSFGFGRDLRHDELDARRTQWPAATTTRTGQRVDHGLVADCGGPSAVALIAFPSTARQIPGDWRDRATRSALRRRSAQHARQQMTPAQVVATEYSRSILFLVSDRRQFVANGAGSERTRSSSPDASRVIAQGCSSVRRAPWRSASARSSRGVGGGWCSHHSGARGNEPVGTVAGLARLTSRPRRRTQRRGRPVRPGH